jgi:uncharacterized membrane protein YqiK
MITGLLLKIGLNVVGNVWLTRIDAFFSLIGKALTFIIKHWQVFLPLAIVGVSLWQWDKAIKQRDAVKAEYYEYKQSIKAAAEEQRLKKEWAEIQGKQRAEANEANRKNLLNQFGLISADRDKLRQQVRESNEKYKYFEKHAADTKFNFDERLRLEAINRAGGMSGQPSDTERLAGSESECDATAYRTLRQACILTTIDFNSCRAALDNDTATVGRDN